ncbi:MAG TPA: ATP-binding protein [Candidatus Paceibacterota bacterium]|nr:ATP-binding protein [Candidatus Paceibacterota bacterium]
MRTEGATGSRRILGVHEDVFLLLVMILGVGGLGAFASGVGPSDLRVLLVSDRALYWIATTALAAFVALVLLRSRRRALQERATLRTFLDGAGDGIIAVDRSFIVTLWNPSAERITGFRASDAVGRPLRDVITFHRERDRAESIVFIEEAMLYGERRSMPESMYVVHKDGQEVPIADSAAPLTDGAGAVTGCIIIFRDVGEEKKRMQLHSEFAHATHQLRTPVTKALWSLESALEKNPVPRDEVQAAFRAIQSLRRMVSKVVDVSKLDQGTVRVRVADVKIAAAVHEALEAVKNEVNVPLPELNVAEVPDDLTVGADEVLLKGILTEILENAVCYGKPDGHVRVKAYRADGSVVIEVADDGLGIRAKEQEFVFSKFFRGSNFESSRCPGAGLGLCIGRGYAELMGGKVWFTSSEGEGTTFFVSLPATG